MMGVDKGEWPRNVSASFSLNLNSDFMEAKVLNGASSLQEDGQVRQKVSDEIGQAWQSGNQ